MRKDIETYVKNCRICQQYKPEYSQPSGFMQSTELYEPWEMIGVDLMGPFPKSPKGNVFLLVCVDYYAKWTETFPLRNATAKTISSQLITEIFTRYGTPRYLLSDRGRQFISEITQQVCNDCGVVQKFTTAYHPQCNFTERVNKTLKAMIASYVHGLHHKWDEQLIKLRFAINSAVQETTGYSPAELNFGHAIKMPQDHMLGASIGNQGTETFVLRASKRLDEIKAVVQKNYLQAKTRQRNYDCRRKFREYKPKDRVWVHTHYLSDAAKGFTAKFAPRWQGPCWIVRRMGKLTYFVVMKDSCKILGVINVVNLHPCYPIAEEFTFQSDTSKEVAPVNEPQLL
uniref:Integrase catalytic domain-containing protein n=1 Tax=Latimeria chalumnae TaxID=7897 RepID=H3B6N1_LATCH